MSSELLTIIKAELTNDIVDLKKLKYVPQVPDETERRADALDDVNPAQFDDEGLLSYAHQYVPGEFADEMQQRARRGNAISHMQPPAEGLDEFSACGFTDSESLVRQFVDGFYFGCEADDPINAWAFKREHLPHQVQLKTLFGSDIGHFDVQDMAGVVPEAYELVERDLITSGGLSQFCILQCGRVLEH